MLVTELIPDESRGLPAVDIEATALKALEILAAAPDSVVLVLGCGKHRKPAGIFSDSCLPVLFEKFPGRLPQDIPVREIMTPVLKTTTPSEDVQAVIEAMTATGCRHIPVLSEERVLAVLGLDTIALAYARALAREVEFLQEYIHDMADAAIDGPAKRLSSP